MFGCNEVHANHAIIFGFQHTKGKIDAVAYFVDIVCLDQCFAVLLVSIK